MTRLGGAERIHACFSQRTQTRIRTSSKLSHLGGAERVHAALELLVVVVHDYFLAEEGLVARVPIPRIRNCLGAPLRQLLLHRAVAVVSSAFAATRRIPMTTGGCITTSWPCRVQVVGKQRRALGGAAGCASAMQ